MTVKHHWTTQRVGELRAKTKHALAGGPFGSNLVSRDYTDEGVPVIRGGNLPDSTPFALDDLVFVSEKKADALRPNNAFPGDLVFTQRGTLGQVGLIPKGSPYPRFIISQSQMKLTVDPERANARYLYYYFRLPSTVEAIQSLAISSGVPHINLDILRKFQVITPPVQVQRKIAAVVSAYDELIENNQRRIALLEKLAEEIYREWFVRLRFPGYEKMKLVKGLPQGWRVAELKELASVNPSAISRRDKPESILYVDISSVSTNRIDDVTPYASADAPGRARRRVKHGDVIWSSVRPANRAYCLIFDPPENLIVSTGFAVIRPIAETPFTFVFFAVTSNPFVDQMTTVAKGAAYPATSFDDFEKAKLLVPSDDLLKSFHKKAEPLFRQKYLLQQQSEQLKRTRDLLLPRLISGKLSVENLDIQFPPGIAEEMEAEPPKLPNSA